MKIKVIESATKRPLVNTKIQLQIKGKESGFLTVTTDATGLFMIDDKYKGHQLLALLNGAQGAAIAAADNATLILDTKKATTTAKEGHKEEWK